MSTRGTVLPFTDAFRLDLVDGSPFQYFHTFKKRSIIKYGFVHKIPCDPDGVQINIRQWVGIQAIGYPMTPGVSAVKSSAGVNSIRNDRNAVFMGIHQQDHERPVQISCKFKSFSIIFMGKPLQLIIRDRIIDLAI